MSERLERWIGNQSGTTEGLERRHWFRVMCDWPVAVDGSSGTVTDISARGCHLYLSGRPGIRRGQTVDIRSLRAVHKPVLDVVQARVEWTLQEGTILMVGLSFTTAKKLQQTWVQSLLTKVFHQGAEQKRSNLRVCCHIPAFIVGSEASLPVTLLDLSLGGALLEAGDSFTAGTHVMLQLGPWAPLESMMIPAVVQRMGKPGGVFRFGVRFERPQPHHLILAYVLQTYEASKGEARLLRPPLSGPGAG